MYPFHSSYPFGINPQYPGPYIPYPPFSGTPNASHAPGPPAFYIPPMSNFGAAHGQYAQPPYFGYGAYAYPAGAPMNPTQGSKYHKPSATAKTGEARNKRKVSEQDTGTQKMRAHLHQCLVSGHVLPFPSTQEKSVPEPFAVAGRESHRYKVYCYCRMPNLDPDTPLVKCRFNSCPIKDFHPGCIQKKGRFTCDLCLKKKAAPDK